MTMLQKIFLWMVGVTVLAWSVYAYQQRSANIEQEQHQEAIVLAHNAFYPQERHYNYPLQPYERDGLSDILRYYVRDERQKKIFFVSDPNNFITKTELQGIHYETFTPIDQSWSRDKNNLYKDGKLFFSGGDVPSVLPWWVYMKNTSNVYYTWEGQHTQIVGADADSFQSLYSLRYYNIIPYAKDTNHVYMLGDRIDDIDPSSVEVLTSFYLQDKEKIVYSDGNIHRILQWVDRENFEVLSDGDGYDAKDSKWYFYQGERVEVITFD